MAKPKPHPTSSHIHCPLFSLSLVQRVTKFNYLHHDDLIFTLNFSINLFKIANNSLFIWIYSKNPLSLHPKKEALKHPRRSHVWQR